MDITIDREPHNTNSYRSDRINSTTVARNEASKQTYIDCLLGDVLCVISATREAMMN